jgi:hypothetical protein
MCGARVAVLSFLFSPALALQLKYCVSKQALNWIDLYIVMYYSCTMPLYNLWFLSGTIIRGTLKAPNSQLVTPISVKLQRPDGCD